MLSAESFWTHSLRVSPLGESITRILASAILAVEPGNCVKRSVQREGSRLSIGGRIYDLKDYRHINFLAIGKASVGMAAALIDILEDKISSGLIITKYIQPDLQVFQGFPILQGGHPVPDEHSLFAGKKVLEFISALEPQDLIFCLISGGGSALVSAPTEGLTLGDHQVLASTLLASGANINEFNSLRRRLDLIKGGGIASRVNGAAIISLIVSDVVGGSLESIASGPTAPDPTTKQDVLAVLEKYSLRQRLSLELIKALENAPETPKPGDPIFEKVYNTIIASSLQASQAALKQAVEEGFHPYLLRTDLSGEACQAAFELSTFLRQARKTGSPVPAPACILAAGETTVHLKGSGQGGRNTELALASVSELADFPGVILVTLASDGEDGPTDSAGAVVTPDTYRRAVSASLHPADFLSNNDSYNFFSTLDDLLKPGPTGTNVNDLVFMFTH
jgi:glycerate 2-kinase